MAKKVAIVQSNYIPWKGYFDLINSVDEFILFDEMQYTTRDWRNRNRIKTPSGLLWLTIPVHVKGRRFQRICDTLISDPEWNRKHWKSILHHYSKAKFFLHYREKLELLYSDLNEKSLSRINHLFIRTICSWLGIHTKISWSSDYQIIDGKTERLVHICKQAGATEYLSGPSARDYIDAGLFRSEGMDVSYMDYSRYPQYEQLYPPFVHEVSILDLILNEGPASTKYMLSFSASHL